MTDQDYLHVQADKWAAERRANNAVQTANEWRKEVQRLQAELDCALAEIKRLKEALS